MPLTITNVLVDIYRGFNAANPYNPPQQPAAASGVAGLLRPHVRNGRFGYNAIALHWTTLLVLPTGADIRSAYNSQLNSFNSANADTVIIPDYPIPGRCTAFLVVLVQRTGRGTADDQLFCYLDRCQPADTCPDSSMVTVPGCSNPLPTTLHVTLTNLGTCACLAGSYPVVWNGSAWVYTGTACSGQTVNIQLSSTGPLIGDWRLTVACATDTQTLPPLSGGQCDPLNLTFQYYGFHVCCLGRVVAVVTF